MAVITYDEFRISVAPAVDSPGQWNVRILKSPIASQVRRGGNVSPCFTREQLRRLRGRSGWPNISQLQDIGTAAWRSIMAPVWASFCDAREVARTREHRLRVVFVVHLADSEAEARLEDVEARTHPEVRGAATKDTPPHVVTIRELPFEVTSHSGGFLATDLDTPVSRGLGEAADRPTSTLMPPLRVLLVVSRPKDKPRGTEEDEAQAIENLLASFPVQSGYISVRRCDPPTRVGLYHELKEGADVLHFIGHGGFYPVAGDPTARAHLCLEDEKQRKSDPIDAYQLSMALKGSGIRLAVLTACSSAAESPYEGSSNADSLQSVAQSIVKYDSDVTATIGMQFDLEQTAACTFTTAFYQSLLSSELAGNVDDAVASARRALSLSFQPGHRVWVTPAVYWRCTDAKVFDLMHIMRPLDPARQRKLASLDGALGVHRENLERYNPSAYPRLRDVWRAWLDQIEALSRTRGELLGDSVRVSSCIAEIGTRTRVAICLHIVHFTSFDVVRVELSLPVEHLAVVAVASAGLTATASLVVSGRISLVMLQPSGRVTLSPGTHEIAILELAVTQELAPGLLELRIEFAQIVTNGRPISIPSTHGVLFVVGMP